MLRRGSFILFTVPASIAFSIACLPILTVWLDNSLAKGWLDPFVFQFSPASARSLLSATATGAMAALSLAYSMALLVFTLAAGNIGPRLLKRFTSELTPQITAGIFGGTFLYSLHALLYLQDDFLPKITIAGAGFLAVLSVAQLIYFVRQIAKNITIDEEIAKITANLSKVIERKEDFISTDEVEKLKQEALTFELEIDRAGYVNDWNAEQLLKLAIAKDITLQFAPHVGDFVLAGQVFAYANSDISTEVKDAVCQLVDLRPTRSDSNQTEFSTRLLVEIALRALSPGINDTYTAVAVVDSLSAIISSTYNEKPNSYISLKDEAGESRIYLPHQGVVDIIDIAFHPLRRASTDNILMAQTLARAYSRIYALNSSEMQKRVKSHAKLLLEEISQGRHLDVDIDSVRNCLSEQLLD